MQARVPRPNAKHSNNLRLEMELIEHRVLVDGEQRIEFRGLCRLDLDQCQQTRDREHRGEDSPCKGKAQALTQSFPAAGNCPWRLRFGG